MSTPSPSTWSCAYSLLLGPLSFQRPRHKALALSAVFAALVVTQLGAVAVWLACGARHPTRPRSAALAVGIGAWLVVWAVAMPIAGRASKRVALPCSPWSGPLRPHSVLYCVAGRNYVDPALHALVSEAAADLQRADATTVVRYLDGGFPLGLGFPLLPHLSHGDGRRLDLMLQYQHSDGSPASGNGSPIGYWGYVEPRGEAACPARWVDLRWDFSLLQPVLSRRALDDARSHRLLKRLLSDPRLGKALLEPHLKQRLGLTNQRIRFQGCRAARHDDHVHIQL